MGEIQDATKDQGQDALNEPIFKAVIAANRPYKNTDFTIEPPIKLGAGQLRVVSFRGEDNNTYINYVYVKKGQEPQVFYDLRRLVAERSGGLFPVWDLEWIRAVSMFIIVILLLVAAGVTATYPDGKAFTAFMSTLTAALGYAAGKGAKTDSSI